MGKPNRGAGAAGAELSILYVLIKAENSQQYFKFSLDS